MTGHEEASIIWRQARERLPLTKKFDTNAEVNYVLKFLEINAPDLYSGSPVPRRTEVEIIKLAKELSSNASESSVRLRFQFLAIGLEIGNKDHGWNVPLVPQLVRVKKARNWATIDNFTLRKMASRIEQAFGETLENPPAITLDDHLGQVLFSAIFFGGLLERGWLEPFLNAVISREFFQHKRIIWVEMVRKTKLPVYLPDVPGESSYTKRFFPDNFTTVLLYRMLGLGLVPCAMPSPKPWDLLQVYLKTLPGITDLQLPGSLDEFLKLAVSRNLFLPGSMLSYATGNLKSTSLAIEPWLRCVSGKAISNSRPEKPLFKHEQAGDLKVVVPRIYSFKAQDALFAKLLKSISPKKGVELSAPETKAIFDRIIEENKNELSPAFQLMIYWGRQLLTPRTSYLERRSKKERVTTGTIRRYFRAIGSAFFLAAENRNLTTIEQVELEMLYEETLENRQSDTKAPQCLYQFHGFLMAFYGRPPIESVELKGSGSGPTNQNANIISFKVYNLVLQGLGWGCGSMSLWQRLRVIAWIICYRCGLRPSELLNLRMIDFQMCGQSDFELVVRVTPKSKRGIRRIPASLYMNDDECTLLLDYFRQRILEIGIFGGNFLLAHPEQRTDRLTDEAIFDPTRTLLRTITKDDTLILYHSRHTFNSRLQIQFQLRGKPLFNQAGFLDLETSTENDRLLRNALMGNENCGRKDQHAQGILVGHSSPGITNQYYNHLSDVLLGSLVRQRRDCVPVSLSAVSMLGGLRQSWAGELLFKSGNEHPLAGLVNAQAKKYDKVLAHPLLSLAVPMSLPAEELLEDGKLPPWEEALTLSIAQELNRGEGNWDFAFQLYEKVRHFRGKRFRSVAIVIQAIGRQLKNNRRRWRGPTFESITELRHVLATLQEIGVSTDTIVLVHHPRRGQPEVEQSAALQLWRKRVDISKGSWFLGEPANAKASKKGVMELRVVNWGHGRLRGNNLPPVIRGFEIAILQIAEILPSVS